ncbi:MAG: hypothetical protein AMS27_16820 [Bacteroides sp. SM23_62_1]|nr:MAG: hypothetical protein AMS27_16820 [Bacteroides sp. SM23_62_1]
MFQTTKKILILIILLLTGAFFSCDEYLGLSVDCSECYNIEPDSADLIIYLTINDDYSVVPIMIYKDQVDDNRIEHIDTVTASPYYLFVSVNQYYSVKAEYHSDGKTIYAVDGDKIETKHVSESCDVECWVISGGIMDVRLKSE